MGCAMSRIDKQERVVICKERKRVMKQLLGYRAEFANAILAYLRALKNTGVTLKQFAESESLELESALPPSPPLPLPPSPPLPPPIDSPDFRKREGKQHVSEAQEEITEIDEDNGCTAPPPPPPLESSWDLYDLLDTSSLPHGVEGLMIEDAEDENWAETRSQFDEENQGLITSDTTSDVPKKKLNVDLVGNDLSIVGEQKKDTVNTAMVVWRRKKRLPAIIKELDDYFLKASAGGKDIAVLVDMGARNVSLHHDIGEIKGKGNKSARVLSSLSWSSSSRALQLAKDEDGIPIEPCKAGAHCITLEKLYAEELILYKAVREEETAKLELRKKSLSLRKHEDENTDLNKIDKIRSTVENLQSDVLRLQELEKRTCSTILTLLDKELHPQLVSLLFGLIHMWRTMSDCHQFQIQVSEQVQHLTSHHNAEPTSEYHRDATVQLESEVNFWYNSFCKLTKSQREYVKALSRWSQLSEGLVDGDNQNHSAPVVSVLCKNWQLALDSLPEKVVSEAIKRFLVAVRSIILQQEEEFSLKKKSDRLERKLHRETNSLLEIEKKLELGSDLSPKHPLSIKRSKIDALRRRYEQEKAKYLSSMQVSRAMTLHNLQTTLPHVFQALMEFSSACTEAFETALNPTHSGSNVDNSEA